LSRSSENAAATSWKRTFGSFRQIHIDEHGAYLGLSLAEEDKNKKQKNNTAGMDTCSCPARQNFMSMGTLTGNY
jgi:hypothetical protein